jgi:GNAT superfamily N-acetyltransferase
MRSTGLGRLLMGFHFTIAKNIPAVKKNMLTCFLSNTKGLAFYERLGFAADEISPGPRNLRGKVVDPDYVIMSKAAPGKESSSGD